MPLSGEWLRHIALAATMVGDFEENPKPEKKLLLASNLR
jgi:hypothetical protein